MSALFALLVVQAATAPAAAPAPIPADDPVKREIVAIGERMKTWRGGIYKKDGQLTCRLDKGSGDTQVDLIRCAALVKCVAPLAGKMDAITASNRPEADRTREARELLGTATPCIDAFHVENVVKLARARVAKR